jgi:hypothetical protein
MAGPALIVSPVRAKNSCAINAIVSRRAGFSPLFGSTQGREMCCPDACAAAPFGRTVDLKLRPDFQEKDQT